MRKSEHANATAVVYAISAAAPRNHRGPNDRVVSLLSEITGKNLNTDET